MLTDIPSDPTQPKPYDRIQNLTGLFFDIFADHSLEPPQLDYVRMVKQLLNIKKFNIHQPSVHSKSMMSLKFVHQFIVYTYKISANIFNISFHSVPAFNFVARYT